MLAMEHISQTSSLDKMLRQYVKSLTLQSVRSNGIMEQHGGGGIRSVIAG